MKSDLLRNFKQVVDDLIKVLPSSHLTHHYEKEVQPDTIHVVLPDVTLNEQISDLQKPGLNSGFTDSKNSSKADKEPVKAAKRSLAVNEKCDLCKDRLFAARNFYRPGKKDILVLYYNAIPGKEISVFDKPESIFAPEEQLLFDRMLSAASIQNEDLHFQQLPGCFFHSGSSTADDWNDRTLNCLNHVKETIKKHSITKVIAVGSAAILLYGEQHAKEMAEQSQWTRFVFEDIDLPCLILRSPASLLVLEQRRKSADEQNKHKLKQKEIQIKKSILDSLKKLTNV